MFDPSVLQILIQGGMASITLVTLFLLYKIIINKNGTDKKNAERMERVVDRNSEASENLCETLGIHSEAIRSLKDVIERKFM